MKVVRYLLLATAVCLPVIAVENADKQSPKADKNREKQAQRNYGDAENVKFVSSGEGLEFVCCIEQWHPVIGRDIPVKLAGVYEPHDLAGEKDFYYRQLALFLTEYLENADITLCNIRRSQEEFALKADVKADGLFVAAELIKRGLASSEPPPKPQENIEKANPKDGVEPRQPEKTAKKTQNQQAKQNQESQEKKITKQQAAFFCSKNSDVFHKKDCVWAKRIKKENLVRFETRKEAIEADKRPCEKCKP